MDGAIAGQVRVGDESLDLERVTAVYLRPYQWSRLPQVERAGPESPEWRHALAVEDALIAWTEIAPALVVNRSSVMAANASKPYQAAQIQALGFAVPPTLVTTDPEAARRFWEEQGEVIYKSVSGTRSIVSRLSAEHAGRLEDIAWCPTQLQRYIPGTDYRVHVIGGEVFASEILSTGNDYRYAPYQGESTEIRAAELPEDCAARCRDLAAGLGLPLAGIDLRRTPEGEWYCFEVNTSPGFPWYEEATGQPMAAAVARLLKAGYQPGL